MIGKEPTRQTFSNQQVGINSLNQPVNLCKALSQLGMVRKADVSVQHQLIEIDLVDSVSDSLLKRNKINPFFKWMFTGDEK